MTVDPQDLTNEEVDELEPKKPRQSQADMLVDIVEGVEFFHQDIDEAFASIKVGDHVETWRVRSAGFKQWLCREFWIRYKKAPSSQAVQDALNVLVGRAVHDGEQRTVHHRVAEHDGRMYLDLADSDWRAVEITPAGWRVVRNPPVRFERSRGMLPLPEPERGGELDELQLYLNVPDRDSFALVKAFLVTSLRPNRPFPFLVLTGEQGILRWNDYISRGERDPAAFTPSGTLPQV